MLKIFQNCGGVESFAYYMVKKYQALDICVLCKRIDINQKDRLEQFCPVYVHNGGNIYCKTIITNYDTSILDYLVEGDAYMVIHADYTQPCYTVLPNFKHPKIKKVLGITQYICDVMKNKFGVDCELCYNPLVLEKKEKPIIIVSATRLSAIKGGQRMKRLAEELDLQGVNYIWYVFTNDSDCINSNNVIFLPARLDVYRWIQIADILFQR